MSILLSGELEVDGNLKVTGTIQNDSLAQVIANLQAQITALQTQLAQLECINSGNIPTGYCDCYGNVLDACEICNGDGPEENYDCEYNCVAEVDCQGICGGNNVPTFQCQNTCVVCNPADCNNLNSNCNSMDISPYLLPDELGISKIFPNPFNPITQIQYDISGYALVKVQVFDIQGREVAQLMNEYQSPGQYQISWNADSHASGMYFIEMVIRSGEQNPVFREVRKVLYLK